MNGQQLTKNKKKLDAEHAAACDVWDKCKDAFTIASDRFSRKSTDSNFIALTEATLALYNANKVCDAAFEALKTGGKHHAPNT
ncbi:hypothetical protein ACQ4M3_01060 [Leptolyngbya sp. AN03gr2]|uniref:hypothetical protein n=1 Tax=unclassified Leptolyngbya TaxID=2650499 RepID=UPI003D3114B3